MFVPIAAVFVVLVVIPVMVVAVIFIVDSHATCAA
jgi:hypothetical protein